MKKRYFVFMLIMACLCTASYAQRKKVKSAPKPKPQPVQLSAAELLYRNMLGATAKVMFVDSVVVEKSLFLSSIPLNPEAGTLTSYPAFFKVHKCLDGSVYENEFKTPSIIRKATQHAGRAFTHPTASVRSGANPKDLAKLATNLNNKTTLSSWPTA